MSFLGGNNKRSSGTPPPTRVTPSGPNMPDLGGPRPTSVKPPPTDTPPVCLNCGKDPTRSPPGAEPEVIKMMFDELERADGLTPWEDKFIADVNGAYEKYGRLSPKQHATLVKIHEEKVVNGGRYLGRR